MLTSMFRPESTWGEMARNCRNTAAPEATMLHAIQDKEFVHMYNWLTGKGRDIVKRADGSVNREHYSVWGEQQCLREEHVAVAMGDRLGKGSRLGGLYTLDSPAAADLHAFFVAHNGVYAATWRAFEQEYVSQIVAGGGQQAQGIVPDGLGGYAIPHQKLQHLRWEWQEWGVSKYGVEFQVPGRAASTYFGDHWAEYKSVLIGGYKFKPGSWVLAKPNEANADLMRLDTHAQGVAEYGPPRQMWFGKVKHIVHVECPAGGEEEVLDVEWHKTADAPFGPYDAQLMAPIVHKVVYKDVRFIRCNTVLPIKIDAVKEHPFHRHLLVMLRRSWLPLSGAGLPVPWPKLRHVLGG